MTDQPSPSTEKPLLAAERQRIIIDQLERVGSVRNAMLSELLNVSIVTIRSDLRELEMQGLLEIVHGGAVLKEWSPSLEPLLEERQRIYVEEKKRIGARAAQMVRSGQTIYVDGGTTTIELINHLPTNLEALQIITQGLNIGIAAAGIPNVEVVMPGGFVRRRTLSILGPQAITFLETLNTDCMFMSGNGFSVEYGVTSPSLDEAELKRTVVQRTGHVILLADSSKYGKRQLMTAAPIDRIQTLITDDKLPDAAVTKLENAGLEVIRV